MTRLPAMTRLRPHLLRAAVGLLLLAIGLAAVLAWQKWREQPLEERYQLEAVTTGDLTQTVTANGTVNPVGLVNVGTQVSGTVLRIHADFNDRVKAGQVLLELDPTTLRATVEQSSGELASAQATLRLTRQEETRMRELHAQEYVSRQELEKAVQAREAAQAQVRTAQGKLARDRANLGYAVIRSPVAGVVVSREVDVGQTVAASFQTPTLFKIARDLSRMQIDSNVAEADIGKVEVGQPVRFTVDAYPERRFEGRVHQIRLAPLTQQNVVTYNVVVEVANPDLALMPGMTAYLAIVTDRAEHAVLVPNAALRFRPSEAKTGTGAAVAGNSDARRREARRPGETAVYVLRGEEIVRVPLRTGISDGRSTVVTEGELKAGDRVVVEELTAERKPAGTGQPFRIRGF
jgi:HlyD family secretion protein